MEIKNIELYFLNTILRISMAGVLLIFFANLAFYPEDILSIAMAAIVFAACLIAYLIRHKFPKASVIIVTSITLAAMSYQRIVAPGLSTTLAVVMIVGFMISVMLKNLQMWIMHGIAALILIFIFALPNNDSLTAGVTYLTLYFVLVFATYKLKSAYDDSRVNLTGTNEVLVKQTQKMERQNKELQMTQSKLNELNKELEQRVLERTAQITEQNQILIRYSYTNAHHLRGPVARLLGLASIHKMDKKMDSEEIIDKMVEQAVEIDKVVKQINVDLAEKDL